MIVSQSQLSVYTSDLNTELYFPSSEVSLMSKLNYCFALKSLSHGVCKFVNRQELNFFIHIFVVSAQITFTNPVWFVKRFAFTL